MLRYGNYNIVFQEIPGEVTLAINLSNCPYRCESCHSSYLREDVGDVLDESALGNLLERYGKSITCLCFMGGDIDPIGVERLYIWVKGKTEGGIKTGWYSGREALPGTVSANSFDYIKLGPYVKELGGLGSPTTNQRFCKVENGELIDETYLFQRKHPT